jgi:NAD(P)-dependent dehydrogenase (short-subunit alcohol dehydrogenase family)
MGGNGKSRGVIVTGAARGIGRAVAGRLARQGWQVALVDVDGEALSAAAGETGGIPIEANVGKETDVEHLVAVARSRLGRLDAIVSNAGFGRTAPLAETALATWNEVLATNLTATFLLAKVAESDLRRARGAIVTIASTRAHMSEPTLACSAGRAGWRPTHALAMTMRHRSPGQLRTPGWIDAGRHGPLKPGDHASIPSAVGVPDDVAAVTYLLSVAL